MVSEKTYKFLVELINIIMGLILGLFISVICAMCSLLLNIEPPGTYKAILLALNGSIGYSIWNVILN